MADVPTGLEWVRAAPEGDDGPGPWIEVAAGAGDLIHLRETSDPDNIVTTNQVKWEAFVKGVLAGEFDHFAELGEGQDRGQDGDGDGGAGST
ncbi:DUF397 domain-containing protein [Streptomyces sp. JV176]|uniref:DUF397 domain-containing protein n=1 Tax=Streptomyces sp. JV176 TaxID=858630 RepID=UPI002E79106C|nr:DUF397 domain-containing protein [Streptomyces sp. JV176]MEE1800655.1 DUF397 domain-containing protein [Streptomyces sp. JV176]